MSDQRKKNRFYSLFVFDCMCMCIMALHIIRQKKCVFMNVKPHGLELGTKNIMNRHYLFLLGYLFVNIGNSFFFSFSVCVLGSPIRSSVSFSLFQRNFTLRLQCNGSYLLIRLNNMRINTFYSFKDGEKWGEKKKKHKFERNLDVVIISYHFHIS